MDTFDDKSEGKRSFIVLKPCSQVWPYHLERKMKFLYIRIVCCNIFLNFLQKLFTKIICKE